MKRISMWSGPRNVSTAMMYAFHHRGDCQVVDEPFYAFYLKQSGLNHPGRQETLAAQSADFNTVLERVVFGQSNQEILFLKNMPHHMLDYNLSFAQELSNFFLIREPRAMIASYLKKIPEVGMNDLGLARQWELYKELCHAGQEPAVIDSGDLLKNPEKILSELCAALEISFEPGMLSWEPGPIQADGAWAKYWYHAVHKSRTWAKQQSTEREIPLALEELALECEKYYSLFKEKAIRA